jgi:integrase
VTGATPGKVKGEIMGTVYRKTATKPLPTGARLIVRKGQRLAEWLDSKEKRRTAPVTTGQDGTDRIVITARTYTAKYRDGNNHVREVATGCRDETAAKSVLADLERRAELVKAKVMSAAEDAIADHQDMPLADHFAAFLEHQAAKGITRRRLDDTRSRLNRVAAECGFRRLADLDAAGLERWLTARQTEGMGAVTRNAYREAWVTFGNWCVRNHRLLSNPLAGVPKADAKIDRRRHRRALTENELTRLLDVARRRPLVDRMTVTKGPRKGEVYGRLRPEVQRRLECLGWERALIYKTLVLTGLRKGELASLTAGQLDLDTDPAYLVLDAADEKNRQGNSIPLRSDLAADLREWLAYKLATLQEADQEAQTVRFDSEAVRPGKRRSGALGAFEGQSCQALTRLPADTPVFTVPAALVKILDRDLVAAGIAKRDERGRTVDVHAMRTTFGTLLSKSGVAPRTAQAAMRHSTINLTMNTYTDPKLLDVAGAMEALPALPLGAGTNPLSDAAMKATGTDDSAAFQFAPGFAPTLDNSRKSGSIPDKRARWEDPNLLPQETQETPGKTAFSRGSGEWAMRDSNSRFPRCKRAGDASEPLTVQHVASMPSPVCTRVCTSEGENANAGTADATSLGSPPLTAGTLETDQGSKGERTAGKPADPLAALAATLLTLSPADRARLAAMLTGRKG